MRDETIEMNIDKESGGGQMFRRTLKVECKKALCNKLLLVVIIIGCAITMMSFVPMVRSYFDDIRQAELFAQESEFERNPLMGIESLFSHWIGSEAVTAGSVDYFFLLPLLAAIPYGWSYCVEKRSGYIRQMITRAGSYHYYAAKYIATFLSGGLAVVLPLLFNFLLTAMFVPAILPDPYFMTTFGVISSSLLSELLYTSPFLYVFLYLMIDFFYGGMIACLGMTVGMFVKNRVAVVILPFFALLGFDYICRTFIYTSGQVIYTEYSPMHFLRPVADAYETNGYVVFIGAVILVLLTALPLVTREAGHELY